MDDELLVGGRLPEAALQRKPLQGPRVVRALLARDPGLKLRDTAFTRLARWLGKLLGECDEVAVLLATGGVS